MAKKQIRYELADLLKDPVSFPKNALNYVLKNKKVVLGEIQSFKGDQIIIRNTFKKKISLNTSDIREVWGEEKVTN